MMDAPFSLGYLVFAVRSLNIEVSDEEIKDRRGRRVS